MHKTFRYPKFSETLKGCPQNFRHCETKSFRRNILIPPLLSMNFFATGNFLKHRSEGFLYEIFRHCETKYSTENRDTPLLPLIHEYFRYQKFCETKKGSPTKFFGTVRQQIFCRES